MYTLQTLLKQQIYLLERQLIPAAAFTSNPLTVGLAALFRQSALEEALMVKGAIQGPGTVWHWTMPSSAEGVKEDAAVLTDRVQETASSRMLADGSDDFAIWIIPISAEHQEEINRGADPITIYWNALHRNCSMSIKGNSWDWSFGRLERTLRNRLVRSAPDEAFPTVLVSISFQRDAQNRIIQCLGPLGPCIVKRNKRGEQS